MDLTTTDILLRLRRRRPQNSRAGIVSTIRKVIFRLDTIPRLKAFVKMLMGLG